MRRIFMDEHPIEGLMATALENLKEMVEVNTIIGDPVESPDGSFIIPVSKDGFGFAAGGSEFSPNHLDDSQDETMPFGGGSGGGVSISPVAFLVISKKGIRMIHLYEHTHIYEKMLNLAPKEVDTIQQMLKESNRTKDKQKCKGHSSAEDEPINFDI